MKRKCMFGAGGLTLPGWECYDTNVDIRIKLPFPDRCASHIHAEHVIEHVTHRQAWNFLSECYRVLDEGGRIRVAIPDIESMWIKMTQGRGDEYMKAASKEGTPEGAIKAAIFNHGHQAAWTGFLLYVFVQAVGFSKPTFYTVGESDDPALRNLEQHGKVVGERVNETETTVLEAAKPKSQALASGQQP